MPKIILGSATTFALTQDINLNEQQFTFYETVVHKVTAKAQDLKVGENPQYRIFTAYNQKNNHKIYIIQLKQETGLRLNFKNFAKKEERIEQVIIDGDIPNWTTLELPEGTLTMIDGNIGDNVVISSSNPHSVGYTGKLGKNCVAKLSAGKCLVQLLSKQQLKETQQVPAPLSPALLSPRSPLNTLSPVNILTGGLGQKRKRSDESPSNGKRAELAVQPPEPPKPPKVIRSSSTSNGHGTATALDSSSKASSPHAAGASGLRMPKVVRSITAPAVIQSKGKTKILAMEDCPTIPRDKPTKKYYPQFPLSPIKQKKSTKKTSKSSETSEAESTKNAPLIMKIGKEMSSLPSPRDKKLQGPDKTESNGKKILPIPLIIPERLSAAALAAEMKADAARLQAFVEAIKQRASDLIEMDKEKKSSQEELETKILQQFVETLIRKNFKPARHQLEYLMQQSEAWISGHKHAVVEQATGTGKTNEIIYTKGAISCVADDTAANSAANPKRILFVVHTRTLVDQVIERFDNVTDGKHKIQRLREDNKNPRKADIWEKFKQSDVVTTIQTLSSVNYRSKIPWHMIRLVVLDEAQSLLSVRRAQYIREEIIAKTDCRVIAITATPFLDIGRERTVYELLGFKPDGSDNPIRPYGIQEAILDGTNVPIVTAMVYPKNCDKIKFKKSTKHSFNKKHTEEAINREDFNKLLVDLYMNHGDPVNNKQFRGMKGIIFCGGIEHAKEVTKEFNSISVELVDSTGVLRKRYETRCREDYIKRMQARFEEDSRNKGKVFDVNTLKLDIEWNKIFKEEYGEFTIAEAIHSEDKLSAKKLQKSRLGGTLLLCGQQMLIEGYDDPEIEFIVRAAPSLSSRIVIQSVGRGLRIDRNNPNKILYLFELAWASRMGAKFFHDFLRDKKTWIPRFSFPAEKIKVLRDNSAKMQTSDVEKIAIPGAMQIDHIQWEPRRIENKTIEVCVQLIDTVICGLKQKLEAFKNHVSKAAMPGIPLFLQAQNKDKDTEMNLELNLGKTIPMPALEETPTDLVDRVAEVDLNPIVIDEEYEERLGEDEEWLPDRTETEAPDADLKSNPGRVGSEGGEKGAKGDVTEPRSKRQKLFKASKVLNKQKSPTAKEEELEEGEMSDQSNSEKEIDMDTSEEHIKREIPEKETQETREKKERKEALKKNLQETEKEAEKTGADLAESTNKKQ